MACVRDASQVRSFDGTGNRHAKSLVLKPALFPIGNRNARRLVEPKLFRIQRGAKIPRRCRHLLFENFEVVRRERLDQVVFAALE